jgi:ABC-type multidrug transport system ATPase subunit
MEFLNTLDLSSTDQKISEMILKEIKSRLTFLNDVGLGYLTLSRRAATLSGGEAQRIRLATQIGSRLTGVLYVLDEPSIGLHQRDNKKLINTLKSMRDLGNTLVVVEHDEETMEMADQIIDIGPRAGEQGGELIFQGTYEETKLGTPQGGNLSPLLSNIMLNELDKELESRGLRFVRYADDCNIYTGSEKAANRVMKSITKFIEKKLGLIVNVSKSKVGRPRDIKFLGFGYYFDSRNKRYEVRPHEISIQKFKRKLKRLTKRSWSISLNKRLLKLQQLIRGWVNYFRIAKMKTVLTKIDSKIRNAIRVVIWKQWKVSTKKIKSLIKLGIDIEQAKGITWCRRGYQFISHSWIIQRTISNKRLEKRGLVSARDHYLKIHTVI